MPAQEKLSQTEQYLAYLTGLGIAVAMAALLLTALGTIENDNITISLLLVGLAMIILGIGGWLILVRPWEKFDDLQTPFYTGHAHAEPTEAAGEAVAEPETEETEAEVVPAKKPAAEVMPAKKPAAEVVPAKKAIAGVVPAKKPAAEVVPAEPDDLTLIEGIGPKSAVALNDAGITTFAQIAAMQPGALEDAIKSRKVRLVGSTETWPLQARLAAAGDLSAFEDLKARIKGGILHDDLTQIEGLGPKTQDALYGAGLRTFADIASRTPDALREVLAQAGLKSVNPDTWPEQAALIVKDDLSGLKAMQDEM